jgi:hypothetical protein
MTIVDACREVGIPRSSFYYIVENNPDVIRDSQSIIDANQQVQLMLILFSSTEILKKLIEDGLSDKTNPKDRLSIFLKLNELGDKLTDNLQVENQFSKDAHEFLKKGPKLEHANSRLIAAERTITIQTED